MKTFEQYLTEYKLYEPKHVAWRVNHGDGHVTDFEPHEDDKAHAKFAEVKSHPKYGRHAWIAAIDQRQQSIRMNSLKAMRKKQS